jgi:transcription elongation factor Elf1
MLWCVFQGCGHLFHIEFNLPDINVCKICKELLTTKASSLGKTANSAIHHFDPSLDVQEADDDEDELSDEDEDSDSDETKNTQAVVDLITQVNAWRRFEGTQS